MNDMRVGRPLGVTHTGTLSLIPRFGSPKASGQWQWVAVFSVAGVVEKNTGLRFSSFFLVRFGDTLCTKSMA